MTIQRFVMPGPGRRPRHAITTRQIATSGESVTNAPWLERMLVAKDLLLLVKPGSVDDGEADTIKEYVGTLKKQLKSGAGKALGGVWVAYTQPVKHCLAKGCLIATQPVVKSKKDQESK